MSSNTVLPPEPVQQVRPPGLSAAPPGKKGCSSGCVHLGFGCAGVILGAFLTIAAEVALVAQGVSWIGDAISGGGSSTPSRYPVREQTQTQAEPETQTEPQTETQPTEFNGVDDDTLGKVCDSATMGLIQEGCRQRAEWIREHGGPVSR